MTEYMSIEEYAALPPDQRRLKHERPKRGKYNNTRVEYDGYWFDSVAECEYYKKLRALERLGAIQALRVHPVYQLQPAFIDSQGKKQRAITYEADFSFIENGADIAVDIKGVRTDTFLLKQKLFLFCYPSIEFRVINAKQANGPKRRK